MFGLSFGASKTKQSSTTDVNKLETVNQTQDSTKNSTSTTNTAGNSSTQSNQATTQAGTSAQNTAGTEQSTTTSKQFNDSVLGGLNSAVGELLSAIPTTPTKLDSNFNKDSYVQAGMQAASSRVNSDLDQSLNSMFDQFGGRDDSNSMATLLANRARSDAGASLAGTRASLEGQAEGIARDNFSANLAGNASQQGYLAQILGALKGGEATQTGNVATTQAATGATTNTGTQTGSQNTQESQSSTTALVEALKEVLAGTTQTVGTEKTKSKGSTIGGGASASF